MGAATNIVIKDGATPAVDHTFVPTNRDGNGVMVFVDQSGDIPVGYNRLTARLQEPSANSANYKVTLNIWRRTLEATSPSTSTGIQPAPTLAYSQIGGVSFDLPKRGTKAERKDIRSFMVNALNNPQIVAMIEDLVNVY